MTRIEPILHVVIDATFADKVRAIRGLVDLYQRTMPDRMEAIRHAMAAPAPAAGPQQEHSAATANFTAR